MRLEDKEITDFIVAARNTSHDCFITPDRVPTYDDISRFAERTGLKTAVFLPGRLEQTDINRICHNKNPFFFSSARISDPLLFASLENSKFEELLLLSAELAEQTEYGYQLGFTRIADQRASSSYPLHLTAVLSGRGCSANERLLELFGCRDALVVGEAKIKLASELFSDEKHKFRALTELAKGSAGRIAIICTTRREAELLSSYFSREKLEHTVFHGGKDEKALDNSLRNIIKGNVSKIIATKSLLQYAPFVPPYNTVCCGVPYSLSHASRIKSLTHSVAEELKCFYCADGVKTLLKLTESYAKNFTQDAEHFISKRSTELLEVLQNAGI